MTVCRMRHTHVKGRISVLNFQYLIGTREGLEHREEIHEMGLFTTDEMAGALKDSGFAIVRYDPEGLIGRGLFVAKADS